MPMHEVKCDVCGAITEKDSYAMKRNKHFFCSQKCANLWKTTNGRIQVECAECGKKFQQVRSKRRRSEALFCCKDCYTQWQRNQGLPPQLDTGSTVDMVCEQCGRIFQRKASNLNKNLEHHFCDWDCYSSWRRGRFTGSQNWSWKGGRLHYGEGWTEVLRERVRALDGHLCVRCNRSRNEDERKLDVHHLVSVRKGGEHTEENLITLCAQCHARVDSAGIDFVLPNRCKRLALLLR